MSPNSPTGGPLAQDLVELIASKHHSLHADLASALRKAGLRRVGGIGASTRNWADYFAKTPESGEKAIEILRQVTADFDRAHGTSITPKLEKALKSAGQGNP